MRIRNLILDKYGRFSGQSLHFRPDAKLHIVFGPNEAGKSSALSAITDLLFKIEARTRYDFLHKAKDLRIGGVIEARDGSRLSFQRRKGNKDTLLDMGGSPIPDESLFPFLGNLTREVFTRAFGLNTETLRQGAEDMLKTGGEIGSTLFAAASGLRGMTDLQRNLGREAEAIFAPRAAKDRRFYQILDRYETARRQIRDSEFKASDWQALNDEIDSYSAKLAEIATKRAENSAEQARLSRLKRVAPIARLIDDDLTALQTVGILPLVASDFANRLKDAIGSEQQATSERTRAAKHQQNLQLEFSSIEVDEALLANAGEIHELFAKTGAYEKDQRDIPRIQAEADGYSAELKQLAIRLGIGDVEHVVANQPADTACVLVQGLISDGKQLAAELEQGAKNIASEAETLGELERQRANREVVPNPRHLRDKLSALNPILKQLDRRVEVERAFIAEKRSIEGAAARLHPPVGNLGAISSAPLPTVETITRFRKEFDRFTTELQKANEHVTKLANEISGIETKLQSYKALGPVPSPDSIAAERKERDETWVLLRDSMIGTPSLTGAALTGTIVEFEQHTSEADRLADSALVNAELVTTHAAEVTRLTEQQAELSSVRDNEAALKKDFDIHVKAWKELWQPAGIDPLPPLEMATWLSEVKALVSRLEKNNTSSDELAQIDKAVASILPTVQNLAIEAGVPLIDGLDTSALTTQINTRLTAVEKLWDDASKLETSIANSDLRVAKLRSDSGKVTGQIEEWQLRWTSVMPSIGLTHVTTIEQAEAALAAWQSVPAILRERDSRQRRVIGMQRDSDDFEKRARPILETAVDLISLPIAVAVKKLNERLTEARSAKARRDQVGKNLNEATHALKAADQNLTGFTVALKTLTVSVVPPDTDLLELLERFSRRDQIAQTLALHRDQLILQGEGFSEDQLRAELTEFDVDKATARIEQLSQENSRLESEDREAFANRKLAVDRREQLNKGVGAELANQQKKNAEAELQIAARDWAILKFGAMLVGHAIEKARGSQHSPLINRAGDLFSTFTGGSFIGLAQDFGEDDIPCLAGRRPSEEVVGISGLSEGARDQMYLALRLAYIEEFTKNAEPVPFIGDDLFTSFDDDRTANGLLALANISEKVQPILFTHHRHVLEIARSTMRKAVDIIEMS